MQTESLRRRANPPAAAGDGEKEGGSPPTDRQSKTTNSNNNNNNNNNNTADARGSSHDVNKDPKEDSSSTSPSLETDPVSRCSTGNYVFLFALLVLLLAVGKWRYDVHMASVDLNLLQEQYREYLVRRWSRRGDEFIANVSKEPSFTNYKNTRVYFRAFTRKIPIAGTVPLEFRTKIAMPEVDVDNCWSGDDEEEENENNNNNNNNNNGSTVVNRIQCMGESGGVRLHYVAFLSTGEQFDSTYNGGGRGRKVEPSVNYIEMYFPCFQKMLPLMCAGDKWEVVCPPEETYGNRGSQHIPPGATTVWRLSVEEVVDEYPRTRKEAERLLADAATTTTTTTNNNNNNNNNTGEVGMYVDSTVPMTRKQLFEKSKKYFF